MQNVHKWDDKSENIAKYALVAKIPEICSFREKYGLNVINYY